MKRFAPLLRILVLLAAAIGGIVMARDRLLYFPEHAAIADLARVAPGAMPWPSEGSFRGLLFEPGHPVRGTVIVFHGNAGHAGHRAYYADVLTLLGWRVLLAEYPGYGPRDGALGEASLVADAAETITLAQRQFGPVVLLGESLGAGVAAAASAHLAHRGVAALLLITPWDTLAEVAAHHYPWLPVRWLLRDRYDSVAHLHSFPRPVIIVVAEDDRIVPAQRGRALHARLPSGARLVTVPGADHNDWFDRASRAWWRDLMQQLPPAPITSVD